MRVSPWPVELRPLLGPPGTAVRGASTGSTLRLFHRRPYSHSHSHSHSHHRHLRRVIFASLTPTTALSRRQLHLPSDPASGTAGGTGNIPNRHAASLQSLLAALRRGETVRLYFCLLDLTRSARDDDQDFCYAVQAIPATTFSDILRTLDPHNIQEHVDSAPKINISFGASVYTPLGDLVNKWGVKALYVKIFIRLRLLQRARRAGDILPLLNDYAVFMRCAGSIADTRAAKDIWWEMHTDGYIDWSHAQLYAEFVKARYLTEALYANNDLARLRLRPLDLHKTISMKPPGDPRDWPGARVSVTGRLKNLASNMRNHQRHRFGQNANELFYAEPLTRILRKKGPLMRLESNAARRRFLPRDEMLVCAILKANGRNGRLVDTHNLFKMCWDIDIFKDPETGKWDVRGGADFPPGSSQAPTAALLDATVHCLGSMAEVDLAARLLHFLSVRYSLAVPGSVWSDLLDYARIMHTKPASSEWRVALWPAKRAKRETVFDIWDMCTQEPHKFRPDMRDYYNLAMALIGLRGSNDRPFEALRHIMPLYREAVQHMRDAWLELILTTQQGVPNHAAYRRYRVLQSRKHYMWYCFHYAVRQILKRTKDSCVDIDRTRTIPDMVRELHPFMPANIEYHIATGIVQIRSDQKPWRSMETQQAVKWLNSEPPWTERRAEERDGEESLPGLEESAEQIRRRLAAEESEKSQDLALTRLGLKMSKVEHNAISEDSDKVNAERGWKEAEDDEDAMANGDDNLVGSSREGILAVLDESRTPQSEPAGLGQDLHPNDAQEEESAPAPSSADPPSPISTDEANQLTPRTQLVTQLVSRPAYMFRPAYFPNPKQPSLSELRADGKDFTGYHDHTTRKHFAAHRVLLTTLRTPGVPVELDGSATGERLVEHVLWMQR